MGIMTVWFLSLFLSKMYFLTGQKSLKLLVASLELWWDSNEIFGMPKGDSASTVHGCSWPSYQWLLERGLVHQRP
jgi:hypothetical protein